MKLGFLIWNWESGSPEIEYQFYFPEDKEDSSKQFNIHINQR